MKKCTEFGGEMKALKAKTPEKVTYEYYRCNKCGDEVVDINQLHAAAEKYK